MKSTPLIILSAFCIFIVACSGKSENIVIDQKKQLLEKKIITAETYQNKSLISKEVLEEQGLWQDPNTGLVWTKCSVGRKWIASQCTGNEVILNYNDSFEYVKKFINEKHFAGYNNWRIPTVKEYANLRKCQDGYAPDPDKEQNILTEKGRTKLESKDPEMQIIELYDGHKFSLPKTCKMYKLDYSAMGVIDRDPVRNSVLPLISDSRGKDLYRDYSPFLTIWTVDFETGSIYQPDISYRQEYRLLLVRNPD